MSFHYREQLLEEEDSADEDFWNQDFFQEEKADEDYESESSEATTADEDFSGSVGCYVELHGFLQRGVFFKTSWNKIELHKVIITHPAGSHQHLLMCYTCLWCS